MMHRVSSLVLLLLASVTACAKEAPPQPAGAAPPSASAPAQQPSGSTGSTAATPVEEAEAAQESVSAAADPADGSDAGLERLAALPADQQLPNDRWKAGTNYTPLVPAQPTSVDAGDVEVVEVFWYGCSHCYALEPYLASWDKNNAVYVKLVKVPVMWSAGHRAHARLFYALEALGRQDLHAKAFEAIHQRGNPLLANSEIATQRLHVDFAKANGIDEKQFLQAYNSFSVNANLQRAERLTQSYRVEGVPLLVVNGKYTTDVSKAGDQGKLLKLLDDLAASEER